jgi:hypothetical protein
MLTTDDTYEITQLAYLYGHTVDSRNWDGLDDVFTPDAVFDVSSIGGKVISGLADIVVHLLARARPTAHIFTNVMVTDEGDETAVLRAISLIPDEEGRMIVTNVRYVAVRTDKGWRFSVQKAESLLRPGPPLVR